MVKPAIEKIADLPGGMSIAIKSSSVSNILKNSPPKLPAIENKKIIEMIIPLTDDFFRSFLQ